MIQQARVIDLASILHDHRKLVEIETNGTLRPSAKLIPYVYRFNVSPKLVHAKAGPGYYNPVALMAFADTGKAIFKFVVHSVDDFDEISDMGLPADKVWIMPEGIDSDTLVTGLRNIADEVLKRGWNLTTRLHVHIWGNQRAK